MAEAMRPNPPLDGLDPSLVEKLEQLARKIDDLSSLFRQMERVADAEWRDHDRSANPATETGGMDSQLVDMAAVFTALVGQRNRIWADMALATSAAPWDETSRNQAGELIDPLWDRLLEIADAMSALPARSPDALRAKAAALKELAEERSDDVVHRLALSLARDLLN